MCVCILQSRCSFLSDGAQYWLVSRQMPLEGGFQGRTNKLVDGCYSFWQGGAFAVLKMIQDGYRHREFKYINLPDAPYDPAEADSVEQGDVSPSFAMHSATDEAGDLYMNQLRLQMYMLCCCQQLDGGMRDKPGKYVFSHLR